MYLRLFVYTNIKLHINRDINGEPIESKLRVDNIVYNVCIVDNRISAAACVCEEKKTTHMETV